MLLKPLFYYIKLLIEFKIKKEISQYLKKFTIKL